MNELLKPELEKVQELICLLEKMQSSLENTDYAINSIISFLQAIKNSILDKENINHLKLKELIDEQEKKVKEIIDKKEEEIKRRKG